MISLYARLPLLCLFAVGNSVVGTPHVANSKTALQQKYLSFSQEGNCSSFAGNRYIVRRHSTFLKDTQYLLSCRLSLLYGAALAAQHGRQLVLPNRTDHLYNAALLAHLLNAEQGPVALLAFQTDIDSLQSQDDQSHVQVQCPLFSLDEAHMWHYKSIYKVWSGAFSPNSCLTSLVDAAAMRLRNHAPLHDYAVVQFGDVDAGMMAEWNTVWYNLASTMSTAAQIVPSVKLRRLMQWWHFCTSAT